MKTADDALRELCLRAYRNASYAVRRGLARAAPVTVLREQIWNEAYAARSKGDALGSRVPALMRAVDEDRDRAFRLGAD